MVARNVDGKNGRLEIKHRPITRSGKRKDNDCQAVECAKGKERPALVKNYDRREMIASMGDP